MSLIANALSMMLTQAWPSETTRFWAITTPRHRLHKARRARTTSTVAQAKRQARKRRNQRKHRRGR